MTRHTIIGAWLLAGGRLRGNIAHWGLALALALALTLLLNGSGGAQPLAAAGGSQAGRESQASQPMALAQAHTPRIARADAHIEALVNGDDLEVNLSITQTEDDCQVSLRNGVCLRYTVVSDERPVILAYGVIPLSAIQVSHDKVVLRVDPSKIAGFTFLMGAPQVINVTWQAKSGAIGALQRCALQGSIGAYSFTGAPPTTTGAGVSGVGSSAVTFAGKTTNAGASVIATIYMR